MEAGRSYSVSRNPSTAALADHAPPSIPQMPSALLTASLSRLPTDHESTNEASSSISFITKSANNAGTNNVAPPRASPTRLTHDHLEANNAAYCRELAFCVHVFKAIDLQEAGFDLDINLPLHCYMRDKSDFAQWIKQQTK